MTLERAADKTTLLQCPFSRYSGALDHVTWSSSADGIAEREYLKHHTLLLVKVQSVKNGP